MSRTVHLVGFALLLGCAVSLQALAISRRRIPTVLETLATLTRRPPLRVLVLSAWLWLGWHLFARGDFG